MKKGAILSDCTKFRWVLWRAWKDGPDLKILRYVMLNPSTADADLDDATIRKCIGFAQRLGFDGIEVVNLFSYRATDPADLKRAGYPVGIHTDKWITYVGHCSAIQQTPVVVAWGAAARDQEIGLRVAHVLGLLANENAIVRALHFLHDGTPAHPLMLPYTHKLRRLFE